MAIAVNPDVRELDFSDNVKVSKFMQDFSDFRMKKWITYRPVNAPSQSNPFYGGTRQFVINMGTGHILDTTYSGLWYSLKFLNASQSPIWPISTTFPRTAAAWIESVTFQHSNVAAHIDERLTDYDAVSSIFVPSKDVKSMDQTFFCFDYAKCADGNPFNLFAADDPYAKLLPMGIGTTQRASYAVFSFFIPLCRLSTIFNSGKYFFPSLLRGNGEMTLSIRAVANSLNEIFGGSNCSYTSFGSVNPNDRIYRSFDGDGLKWMVSMDDMKLVTLNLDNAFLTKEYNAFIASGRKFIRSFKGYNYQYYQVQSGYNRIEIANTHQSISHIILAFQTAYSMRLNGNPSNACGDILLGNQRTMALPKSLVLSTMAYSKKANLTEDDLIKSTVLTPANKPKDGSSNEHFHKAEGHYVSPMEEDVILNSSLTASSTLQQTMTPKVNFGSKVVDLTKSIVNSVAGTIKTGYSAAVNAMEEGKSIDQAINTGIGTMIKDVGNKTVEFIQPKEEASVGGVRSKSAFARRGKNQKHLTDAMQNITNTLDIARQNQTLISTLLDNRPILAKEEIEEWKTLITALYPDFDWTTINKKSVTNPDSFVSYIKNLLTSSNAKNKNIQIRFKEKNKGLGFMTKLTQFERSLLAALLGNTNTKVYQLAGKLIESRADKLTGAEIQTLRYAYANNITIPSDQTEYFKLCEKAAASEEAKQLCEEIIITKELLGKGTVGTNASEADSEDMSASDFGYYGLLRATDGAKIIGTIINNSFPAMWKDKTSQQPVFSDQQREYLAHVLDAVMSDIYDAERILWHSYDNLMLPCEAKQIYDMGPNLIERLQVYRGTGNGETVFSEPVNENMFYHISREAMGDKAEDHPFFSRKSFDQDGAYIVISLNTFMRDAHHEFWDGFSTNRVADRLYVEFENTFLLSGNLAAIPPWYYDTGYVDNCQNLICKVFTVYDNIYYIDRNNNLNVSDTLLPLQESRGPISE